jgi:hypothetical protein
MEMVLFHGGWRIGLNAYGQTRDALLLLERQAAVLLADLGLPIGYDGDRRASSRGTRY